MNGHNDLNALAERLREYTTGFPAVTDDGMVLVPFDVATAAADALAALVTPPVGTPMASSALYWVSSGSPGALVTQTDTMLYDGEPLAGPGLAEALRLAYWLDARSVPGVQHIVVEAATHAEAVAKVEAFAAARARWIADHSGRAPSAGTDALSGNPTPQTTGASSTDSAPSVDEAREAVHRAIDDFGDDRFSDRHGNWDLVNAALDAYAAAIRADLAPPPAQGVAEAREAVIDLYHEVGTSQVIAERRADALIAAVRAATVAEAVRVVKGERCAADETGEATDVAYNLALDHAVTALRALADAPATPAVPDDVRAAAERVTKARITWPDDQALTVEEFSLTSARHADVTVGDLRKLAAYALRGVAP